MTAPTPAPVTNTAAQIVGGVLQAIMQGGETAAQTYLTAQFPILANPILSQILSTILSLVAGPIQTYLINCATGIVIKVQTSVEQGSVINAATALQLAQSSGDQQAIDQALATMKGAYEKLGLWDGVFNPP